MCIATGLAYTFVPIIYFDEAITFDPAHYKWPLKDIPKLLHSGRIIDVYVVLAWTAEFAVKISLLLFFKVLVKRVRRLTSYVNFVIGIVAVVWAVLVCEPFIFCPHFGLASLGKFGDANIVFSFYANRTRCKVKCRYPNIPLILGLSILIAILDIFTDLLSTKNPLQSVQSYLR